jgi:hypothetical protein
MVILVGHARDEHCDYLEEILGTRGREPTVRVSLGDLPEGEFSWDVSGKLRIGDIVVAQDWITTRDGRTVFLEANPNGQWLFMDRALGGAIGEAVAGELERLATMART